MRICRWRKNASQNFRQLKNILNGGNRQFSEGLFIKTRFFMEEVKVPSSPAGFTLESHLGSGTFGSVWLARHTKSGDRVAIKVIPKSSLRGPEAKTRFVREVTLHKIPNHPYIVPLYEATENLLNYYLVMEYVEKGTLKAKLNDSGAIEEPLARHIFSQICEAVRFLHCEMKVAHRDLKAENVLIDGKGDIRVIDFGLSREWDADGLLKTKCGSPRYAAPEMYGDGCAYTKAVDLWSLGVILFYMTTARFPFDGESKALIGERVLHHQISFPSYLSKSLRELLGGLLQKDPLKRMTIEQAVAHPWVAAGSPRVGSCRFPPNMEKFEDRWTARMQMLNDVSPAPSEPAPPKPSDSRNDLIARLCSTGRFKPKTIGASISVTEMSPAAALAYKQSPKRHPKLL